MSTDCDCITIIQHFSQTNPQMPWKSNVCTLIFCTSLVFSRLCWSIYRFKMFKLEFYVFTNKCTYRFMYLWTSIWSVLFISLCLILTQSSHGRCRTSRLPVCCMPLIPHSPLKMNQSICTGTSQETGDWTISVHWWESWEWTESSPVWSPCL